MILAKGMVAIWHESLYHSEDKSRQNPTGLFKLDLRLFMYFWALITNNTRNRKFGTADGVTREYGEYLHRDNLDPYMCKYFYDEVCEFPHCAEGEAIIDCRDVPSSSYS